jgi:hypothetical protein
MVGKKKLDITAIAHALKAEADESRRRQIAAMKSQLRPRLANKGDEQSQWQEIAVRIMEDNR